MNKRKISFWNFNKLEISARMLLSTIITLVLFTVLAIVSFGTILSLEKNAKWVDHTYKVLAEAATIEKLIVDLETGQRGFLITGKENFLEPFHNGRIALDKKIESTKRLVSDNPPQVERLDRIELLVDEWLTKSGNVEINLRKQVGSGGKDANYLQQVLSQGAGQEILNKLRKLLSQLDATFAKANNLEADALVISIAKDMVDQETGQRGFLITGMDSFLEPYRSGQQSLKKHIEKLNDVVDRAYDRRQMLLDIDQLEQLTQEWESKIAQPQMKLREEVNAGRVNFTAVNTAVTRAEGKALFDQMRKVTDRINKAFDLARNKDGQNYTLSITKSLIDYQTGLRGYLLTGREVFLEPYYTAQKNIQDDFSALRGLVADAYDTHKVRRQIALISELANEWQEKSAKPEIQARLEMNKSKVSMSDVVALIEAETGKNISDQIRAQLAEFSGVERELMEERIAKSEQSTQIANWTITLGTLFVIAISLLFSMLIIRVVKRQLQNTSDVANTIAAGNYDIEVKLQSNKDYLGKSLQKMTQALRDNTSKLKHEKTKLETQDWIKSNQASVLAKLQETKDLVSFADFLMRELVPLLKAHLGIFYYKNTEEKESILTLLGSYAYKSRKSVSNQFALGEGLVGQCALEKETILLTNAPDNYIEISSGSGSAAPQNIIVVPVIFENETIAVIEIASVIEFEEKSQHLIELLSVNLGVLINNIVSKDMTDKLLLESQKLSKELQEQQEELRATNEELEEKTQVLKENEEELKAQSEELQAANEELEEKSDRLEKQNQAIIKKSTEVDEARKEVEQRAEDLALASKYKSEFLANMSHELRTPLNSLLILSKELESNKEHNLTERQVESAKVIHQGGQDLLTLINDILDLSKIEAGKLQVDVSEIYISDFLSTLKSQFDPIVKEKGLAFITEIEGDKSRVIYSDEQRLSQVIKNFFFNAVKFTHEGSITIKVSFAVEGMATFSVIDTGIGIPKEKQKQIFEAFQQGDGATNRNYGGTGLGLAISKAMAELLGGYITLESEPGKGSAFILTVPYKTVGTHKPEDDHASDYSHNHDQDRKQIDQKMVQAVIESQDAVEENSAKPNLEFSEKIDTSEIKPRIYIDDDRDKITSDDRVLLIIEDDQSFAKTLMGIARDKGYLCLVAGDGHSGIALAKKYHPAAIVLDLGLPDVDGLQVLEQLKFELETRHIPIHIVSAREEVPELKQKGAMGYLLKPADEESILTIFESVESVLNSKVKKVLVVDDDEISHKAIESLIGSDVTTLDKAYNGAEAKEKIITNPYDCIILDLSLPDFSGFELLKQLKNEGVEVPPVVVYTGRELSKEEHDELRRYSSSIVLKGAESPERLLDEMSLFLHSVESDLSDNQRSAIKMFHNAEKLLKNRKILLVDDDVRNIFALSSTLEGYGLDVIVASNGKVALDKLKNEEGIELVVMDIMMPIMDGYEAMEKIRLQEKFHDLPIIALTAKAMAGDREKCIESGANDYITKPVDVEKLVSMMKVWLFK